ncbi:hypothetical protein CORC01_04898 [Colletotrichum orchidophilum]|uniref:Uncharacterized protein n=1 Tax=Colletotrichum orchidophilum TaxID=1209926 RepID=A0A1G4BEN1_9PEZI|nr:uncharacterized protein CORC01_04898 [Colletotrichum orchidophilum]OHE99762.1 hypothetical protein CORC01_04898 [Colletotrichum orchidophilum]
MRKPVVGQENAGPCVAEATTLVDVEDVLVLLLLELDELLVDVVVRVEDELELKLELEVELEVDVEVLLGRDVDDDKLEEDELDNVEEKVELVVVLVVAVVVDEEVLLELELVEASVFAWTLTLLDGKELLDVDEDVEDDVLVSVANVEPLDDATSVLGTAMTDELEEEPEEELEDELEDDEEIAVVLKEELLDVDESEDEVEVLVADVDEVVGALLVVEAKLAGLTVTLGDVVLERILLELLVLVDILLLVALVLPLVLVVEAVKLAGLTVIAVDEGELVVDRRVAALTVALEEEEEELGVELLESWPALVLLTVEIRLEELKAVGDAELMLVDELLVVDTREAASTVGLEEEEEELVKELLENLLVEVLLVVEIELDELTVVLEDELMEELPLIVGVVFEVRVAALTVELEDEEIVTSEELLGELLDELLGALDDELEVVLEDELAEILLADVLLLVDRRVAALTVGLVEDVLEGILPVVKPLEVEPKVVEVTVELEDDEEPPAELLEDDAVVLLLVGSNVAALAVGLTDDEVLEMVEEELLVVEVLLDVEADVAGLAEVLVDDELLEEAMEVVETKVAGLTDTLAEDEPTDDGLIEELLEEDEVCVAERLVAELDEVVTALETLDELEP